MKRAPFVKCVSLVLLTFALLSFLSLGAAAEAPSWSFDDGVLSVYSDFDGCSPGSYPWSGISGGVERIVIADGVTALPRFSFALMRTVVSVSLPGSLLSVGDCAFLGCTGLSELDLPDSLRSVGAYAFCRLGISELTLPNSLERIGSYAFGGCRRLERVKFDCVAPLLGENVFAGCSLLSSVLYGGSGSGAAFLAGDVENPELHSDSLVSVFLADSSGPLAALLRRSHILTVLLLISFYALFLLPAALSFIRRRQ